jgi:cytochrome P450
MSVAMLLRIMVSTIAGGVDTMAVTTLAILFYLTCNSAALTRLHVELAETVLVTGFSGSCNFKFADMQKLPYLDAMIKESMRLYSVMQIILERTVLTGGVTIHDIFIPAGTIVGCSPWVIH